MEGRMPDLVNRDALLEALADGLREIEAHHEGLRVTDLKISFVEEGQEIYADGLACAIGILAHGLWQATDCTDLSGADALTVGTY